MRVEQAPAAPSRHVSPRQAIAELQRTQQLLAEAQALAHIGSWEWDLVTDRITWSDEHYRIFGFELGTPIDFETASRCVHPADRDRAQQVIKQSLSDRQPYVCELRIVRPHRTDRVVEARRRLECDAAGHPVRKVGTIQDVTQRAQAPWAIHPVGNQYPDLVGNACEAVFPTSPDG